MSAGAFALRSGTTTAALRDSVIEKAISGDAKAFAQIYNNYKNMVAKLAYNITGSYRDVEDIVQDTFLQVYKSLHSFERESKFSTWLFRVTINVSLQHLRKKKKEGKTQSGPNVDEMKNLSSPEPDPEQNLQVAERRKILMEVLEKISQKKRIVFILHELHGISAEEIAKILHIPILTVRTRLFYARKAIYTVLMNDERFAEAFTNGEVK